MKKDSTYWQQKRDGAKTQADAADAPFWWGASNVPIFASMGDDFASVAVANALFTANAALCKWVPGYRPMMQRIKLPRQVAFLKKQGNVSAGMVVISAVTAGVACAVSAPLVLGVAIMYGTGHYVNFINSPAGEELLLQINRGDHQKVEGIRRAVNKFVNVPIVSALGDIALLAEATKPSNWVSGLLFGAGALTSLVAAVWAGREVRKDPERQRDVSVADNLLAIGTTLKAASVLFKELSWGAIPVLAGGGLGAWGYRDQGKQDHYSYCERQYKAALKREGKAAPAVA